MMKTFDDDHDSTIEPDEFFEMMKVYEWMKDNAEKEKKHPMVVAVFVRCVVWVDSI